MKWKEFAAYMSGLDGKTPLGRIVSIRSESDPEMLKQFTPEQRRIRADWRLKKTKQMPKQDLAAVYDMFKNAFISMAGGVAKVEAVREGAGNAETNLP